MGQPGSQPARVHEGGHGGLQSRQTDNGAVSAWYGPGGPNMPLANKGPGGCAWREGLEHSLVTEPLSRIPHTVREGLGSGLG